MRKKLEKKVDPRVSGTSYNKGREHLPPCIICDLDGTLSLMNGRSPFEGEKCGADELNHSVFEVIKKFHALGTKVFLFSGRNSSNGGHSATVDWLDKHGLGHLVLQMRKSGDFRKDTIVKQEMFDRQIKDRYKVTFALDDRNMMVDHWRSMGIDCFQVYYGDF